MRRVFLALPEPVNVASAVGAFAGLRTGDVLELEWRNIDLAACTFSGGFRKARSRPSRTKSRASCRSRARSPPILKCRHLETGGSGKLFGRRGGKPGSPPQSTTAASRSSRRSSAIARPS
ncbi:MAG: hypothetical protein BGO98_24235 [Myxococcales bacterium 68-20]|nr:MAG: hypothetical protein BGO98_24235 [Myxococcales bacterium 68-20]